MPSFETTRRVRHSAVDMFALVADVEKYPQFIPLCESVRVRGRRELDGGQSILVADMTISYKVFRETFTTKVTLDPDALEILVEYLGGPVSELENKWHFRSKKAQATDVHFKLNYEFKNRTFAALMGAVFDRVFRRFAEAFEQRANEIYGNSSL